MERARQFLHGIEQPRARPVDRVAHHDYLALSHCPELAPARFMLQLRLPERTFGCLLRGTAMIGKDEEIRLLFEGRFQRKARPSGGKSCSDGLAAGPGDGVGQKTLP